MSIRSVTLGFILLLALPAAAEVCGQVSLAQGRVEVLRIKEDQKATSNPVRKALRAVPDTKLLCRDIVVTRQQSRAKIRFGKNSVMSLAPRSRLAVKEHVKTDKDSEPSLINLTYGKIRAFFEGEKQKPKKEKSQDKGQARWSVQTSSAVVGVRGTDFFVSFDPNTQVTEQATLKGEVVVEQKQTGKKAVVKKGKQVTVSRKGQQQKSPSESSKKKPGLEVKPLAKTVIRQIQDTSEIAKDDKRFQSQQAIKILGPPEKWQSSQKDGELPADLEDLKEEY